MLPTEQTSIHGPCTRSGHRQCGAGCRQKDWNPTEGAGKSYPHFNDCDQRPTDRRPEAHKQKDCCTRSDQMRNNYSKLRCFDRTRESGAKQKCGCDHTLQKKAAAGPAIWKCGEETLQGYPFFRLELRVFTTASKTPKRGSPAPSFGGSIAR